jgi:hypothetical protein
LVIRKLIKLKKEYQLIKQYEQVLEHSELYLEALQERAKEIVKLPRNVRYKSAGKTTYEK